MTQADAAGHLNGNSPPAIYYLLIALNLVGLAVLGWVNLQLQGEFARLEQRNHFWTNALTRSAALGRSAKLANAPLNDLFHTQEAALERKHWKTATENLAEALAGERALLDAVENTHQRERLHANLAKLTDSMQWMQRESADVFHQFEKGRRTLAAGRMAIADRAYGQFLDIMSERYTLIRGIQDDLFLEGGRYRNGLNALALAVNCVIAALSMLVALVGRKLWLHRQAAAAALGHSESALRSLNDELQRSLGLQRQFVADAAHQLRTPIAGIKIQTERALAADSIDASRPALGQLLSAVNRATHLLNQLLSLATLEPGAEKARAVENLDLAELARNAGAEFVAAALARNVEIEFHSAGAAMMRGDPTGLRELVSNLVENALKYSPDGSRIRLSVARGPCPELVVEDNGPGIPEDQRGKVFQRFYRVAGNQAPGAGLGLAIVGEVARLHRATITLEDPPGGCGLLVRVRFPTAG